MKERSANVLLLVLSGPSGSGKTTLCRWLVNEFDTLVYSVSCTTRPARTGEREGTDYYFLGEEAFGEKLLEGEFLEHARVHQGQQYGTLRSTVEEAMMAGHDVLMDIDVQGASQIRSWMKTLSPDDPLANSLVDVFILPPSMRVLGDRLRERGQDGDEAIAQRLQKADEELSQAEDYAYRLVNDDLDRSCEVVRAIVLAEHHRVRESEKRHVS